MLTGRSEAQLAAKGLEHTAAERALWDMVKDALKKGGLSKKDAKAMEQLSKEIGDKFEATFHRGHPSAKAPSSRKPHLQMGKKHIPIKPNQTEPKVEPGKTEASKVEPPREGPKTEITPESSAKGSTQPD